MKNLAEQPTDSDIDEDPEKNLGDPDMRNALRIRLDTITPEDGYIEWFKRHHRAFVGLGSLSLAGGFAAGGLIFSHRH